MISFNDAVRQRLSNKYNDWTESVKNKSEALIKNDYSAQRRFLKNFFFVNSNPKFKISKNSSVYTIGSCFARNVEQALLKEGLVVPTALVNIDSRYYVSKPRFNNTILNKYNPYSMAVEILRGLGALNYDNRGLIEVSDGKWYDPAASHLGLMTYNEAIVIRDQLDQVSSEIVNSDVILLTLGLTESWFDRETSIVFNQINPAQLRGVRDRLIFKNLNVSTAYEKLAEALQHLRLCKPDIKVVITVSPVPLLNTFTEWDVVAANTYSKSVLRVVAQMLADNFDYIDYYPSFEMVNNSQREFSWAIDQAHVSDRVVNCVISEFVNRYIEKN